jgi:hypothetical protein
MLRPMSAIHFIGGEKGGVGKSVVARLLAQFCIDRGIPYTAFDADPSHGALMRFYAGYCRAVDLSSFDSADEVFTHACEDGSRRVLVDLPAQSERPLAAWMEASGIVELAGECKLPIVFWHVMDDGKDSLAMLGRLLGRYGESASYCVVKNLGRGKDFSMFDASAVRGEAERLKATILELPELHPPVMQKIDRADASFWAAVNGPGPNDTFTRLDRQRVRVWLYRIYERLANVPYLSQPTEL